MCLLNCNNTTLNNNNYYLPASLTCNVCTKLVINETNSIRLVNNNLSSI